MKIKIIGTGSKGNCYILEDKNGRCLLLECGVSYSDILLSPHWCGIKQVDALLVSHSHKDHSLELRQFKQLISPSKIVCGAESDLQFEYDFDNWKVRPLRVFHNVQCHGFLIFNKAEKKTLAFFTDCKNPPKIAGIQHWLYEVNYDEQTAKEVMGDEDRKKNDHIWFNLQYHNSLEHAADYFKAVTHRNGKKASNIITIHGSSDYLNKDKVAHHLGNYAENLFVGENGGEYEI